MDVFSLAIELGKAIQEDERYINFKIASQKNDEDKNLQDLINDFNLKKLSINNEITKDKKDGEKIRSLNDELKNCYKKIMDNENMKVYYEKKQEFDGMINKINKIISGSALGDDPVNLALNDENPCTGNCSGCHGCH